MRIRSISTIITTGILLLLSPACSVFGPSSANPFPRTPGISDSIKTTDLPASSPDAKTEIDTPIPSPSGTEGGSTTPTAMLSCRFSINGKELQILHDDRIFWTDMDVDLILQVKEKLVEIHPDFYQIHQSVYYPDSDKTVDYKDGFSIIWQASGIEQYYVNPFIVLVTVGEKLGWHPPAEGNLYQQAEETRLSLLSHYRDFCDNQDIQNQNSIIPDPSSYMIYAYYNADIEKINQWCESYYGLVGQHPGSSLFDD